MMEEDCALRGDGLPKKELRRAGSVEELEREVFRMGGGGEDGCRPAFHQRVGRYSGWIEAQDLAVPGLIDVAEGH